MRKGVVWFLSVLLLGAGIISCKQPVSTGQSSVQLDSCSLSSETFLNNDPTSVALNMSVSIVYPADYNNKEVLNKVRKVVLKDFFPETDSVYDTACEAVKAQMAEYIRFFNEAENAYIGIEPDNSYERSDLNERAWHNRESMKVRQNGASLFSYTLITDRYNGGAHGTRQFTNRVIDLKTGNKLTENDLFPEETQPIIIQLIIDEILKIHQLKTVDELIEIGYFDISDLKLNGNFYLTDKGLTYTFNEYEIGSYEVGKTDVTLPFNKLSSYFKKDNPLSEWIQ